MIHLNPVVKVPQEGYQNKMAGWEDRKTFLEMLQQSRQRFRFTSHILPIRYIREG